MEYFVVNGTQRIFGCALVECLDARHLDGRSQVGISLKHGGVDEMYFVIGGAAAGHVRQRVLSSHQTDFDFDLVEQETIL